MMSSTSAVLSLRSSSDRASTFRRSNGSVFTVGTLAVYFLHDVEHHLHDLAA